MRLAVVMYDAEEHAILPAEIVHDSEDSGGLEGLVEVLQSDLAEDVDIGDVGLEIGHLLLEAGHPAFCIEREASPAGEVQARAEAGLELGIVRVESVATQESPEARLRASRAVLLFDRQHAARRGDGKAPAHREAKGKTECLLDGEVTLAELLLSAEPAATIRREQWVDERLHGWERLPEELAGAEGPELGLAGVGRWRLVRRVGVGTAPSEARGTGDTVPLGRASVISAFPDLRTRDGRGALARVIEFLVRFADRVSGIIL